MKRIVFVLLTAFAVNNNFAQWCGGGDYEPNPLVIPQEAPSFPEGDDKCYTIPVTFHFNKSSTGIIHEIPNFDLLSESNSIIQNLNDHFSPYNIYFELSEYFEYTYQKYYDAFEGGSPGNQDPSVCAYYSPDCIINNFYDQVKTDDALNIMFFHGYISVDLPFSSGPSFRSDAGMAFKGIGENGILCRYDYRLTEEMIHEVGHVLGLYHTFRGTYAENPNGVLEVLEHQAGACLDDGSGTVENCKECGDYCCDTEISPLLNVHVDNNCNYTGPAGFTPDVNNYMGYAPGHCRTMFTPDQTQRMYDYLNNKQWMIDITELSYFDLAIRDNATDDLTEPNWSTTDYDNGPDIWVRNNNLGDPNAHQNPAFNHPTWGDPNVKLRIHNTGCVPSSGTETVTVYWATPSLWQGWPGNWIGGDPYDQGEVGTLTIPVIQPGESTVLTMPWSATSMPTLPIGSDINACLLAKIDGGIYDPLQSETYDLWIYNNNVALRNLTVIDYGVIMNDFENAEYDYNGDVGFIKGFVIENIESTSSSFDFDLVTDPLLLQEAEVYYTLPIDLYNHIANNLPLGMESHRSLSNTVLITNPQVTIENFVLEGNERLKVTPGINFLRSEVVNSQFTFKCSQRRHGDAAILGSEHYKVIRPEREMFVANSGDNMKVLKGESVQLLADDIGEDAEYKWFDSEGNLLYIGQNITLTAEESKELQLEVVTQSDQYKDYDQTNLVVTEGIISSISPNPVNTTTEVCVELSEGINTAVLMVYTMNHNVVNNYMISGIGEVNLSIDVSSLNNGIYQTVLVIDGTVVDIQQFVKE